MRLADSNILLYAVSADPLEANKRARAIEVLADRDNLALSVQVLAEFYYQATRKSRANRLTHQEALRFIETLRRIPLQPVTEQVFWRAKVADVMEQHLEQAEIIGLLSARFTDFNQRLTSSWASVPTSVTTGPI